MSVRARLRGAADRIAVVATRKKPLKHVDRSDVEKLGRVLSVWDAIGIGIGTTIGAGIFVLTGVAAREYAGPAISISFFISGFACVFSGLAYAEFASRFPFAGSAYLYSYLSMGELLAWIVGWDLFLEYVLAAAAVSRGWAAYLVSVIRGFGGDVPEVLYNIQYRCSTDITGVESCSSINLLSGVVLIIFTILCATGTKMSTTINTILNVATVAIILFVIVAGSMNVDPKNWSDFVPYGAHGIFRGAAVIFFAFVGFDTVSAFAEELRHPKRDIPLAILGTLGICTTLYVGTSLVVTGMVRYDKLDLNAPLSTAFSVHGWAWGEVVVAFGAFFALTTSVLTGLLGMPRIFFAMARDGLFFKIFGKIHPKFGTPFAGALFSGFLAILLTLFLDIESLSDMVSIGTLLAFVMVDASVMVHRYNIPENKGSFGPTLAAYLVSLFVFLVSVTSEWNPAASFILGLVTLIPICLIIAKPSRIPADAAFVCPWSPFVPMIGIACNLFLMINLGLITWLRMVGWGAIGLIIYAFYGAKHSLMNDPEYARGGADDEEWTQRTRSDGDEERIQMIDYSEDKE